MSMTMPSSTCSCFDRRLSNRSSTINLTLLSASLTMSSANAAAAAALSAIISTRWRRKLTLDGGWVLSQCRETDGSLVFDRMRGRVQ
jgi:hypothetical protein